MRVKRGEYGSSAGIKGRGKQEIPEKTHRPEATFCTIPTCENPGVARPGTEHGRGEVSVEQCRNARVEETVDLRENSSTSGMFRHDFHMRKSEGAPTANRTRFALVGGELSNHYTTVAQFLTRKTLATGKTLWALFIVRCSSKDDPEMIFLGVGLRLVRTKGGSDGRQWTQSNNSIIITWCFVVRVEGLHSPPTQPGTICVEGAFPPHGVIRTPNGITMAPIDSGASVVPPTSRLGEPRSIPGGAAPGPSHVGIVPDDAIGRRVLSGISSFQHLHSGSAPSSPRLTPIGSQDLAVKSRPNLFTHSPNDPQIILILELQFAVTFDKLAVLDGKVSALANMEYKVERMAERMRETNDRLASLGRGLETQSAGPLLGEFASRGALSTLKLLERKVDRLLTSPRPDVGEHDQHGRLVIRCNTPVLVEDLLKDVSAKVDVIFDKTVKEDDAGMSLRSDEVQRTSSEIVEELNQPAGSALLDK
ncbi:hypothetical protein PR048_018043 [Dryococelus australis]|uniref:Uncharacterized protein n=1 Tax=Dryococelus australis TaxID=614101 RepID=A0ABQ9HBD2_9NEOP|nr:hypothetical protein PR048_018043 [Dryococelus australis]